MLAAECVSVRLGEQQRDEVDARPRLLALQFSAERSSVQSISQLRAPDGGEKESGGECKSAPKGEQVVVVVKDPEEGIRVHNTTLECALSHNRIKRNGCDKA